LFGGRTSDTANNDLFMLDPAAPAWRKIVTPRDAPAPRFGHDAWYDVRRKRLIIALGQGNDRTFFNDVWAYDANGWTQLTASGGGGPEIRYGAGSAYDRDADRLLISHGFTDQGRYDDSWSFDLANSSWTQIGTSGEVPIKRCLTRCLWLPASQSMLLFAGQTDNNPFLGDQWKLDVGKGKWTEQTPAQLPSARNLYGAALDTPGKHWYITSGNTPTGAVAETWSYDVGTDTWTILQAAVLPPARYSADAAIAAGKLYLFGGHNGDAEINDTWTLPLA
jgi:Galactose oxidase, central domain